MVKLLNGCAQTDSELQAFEKREESEAMVPYLRH